MTCRRLNRSPRVLHRTETAPPTSQADQRTPARHTEPRQNSVEVRKLGGRWPDHEFAMMLNRIRYRAPDGRPWTTMRVQEPRERFGTAGFSPSTPQQATLSVDVTARHRGSVSARSIG